MTTMAQGPSLMLRISTVTGVISAFIVLNAPPASAEKVDPRMYFRGRRRQSGQGANQVLIDTERPEVDLRIAQTMGTDDPINMHKNDAALKDSIHLVSDGSKISLLSASVTQSS